MELATTGVPHAMASTSGKPNPFAVRRQQHEGSSPVQRRQGIAINKWKLDDGACDAEFLRQRALRRRQWAADPKQSNITTRGANASENLEQHVDPLAWNRAANMQQLDAQSSRA